MADHQIGFTQIQLLGIFSRQAVNIICTFFHQSYAAAISVWNNSLLHHCHIIRHSFPLN